MRLKGKIALVTGGAGGIGRATALALARDGADVAIGYCTSAAEAHETVRLAEQAGVRALAVQADVTRDGEVRAMVDRVAEELGGLDCLVNNAGWTRRGPHRRPAAPHPERWGGLLGDNLRAARPWSGAPAPPPAGRGARGAP